MVSPVTLFMTSNANLLLRITTHSNLHYIHHGHGIQQLFPPFPPVLESQESSPLNKHVSRICRTTTQITQNCLTVRLLSAYAIQITHKLVGSRKGCPTPPKKPANQIIPFTAKDMTAQRSLKIHTTFISFSVASIERHHPIPTQPFIHHEHLPPRTLQHCPW